MLKLTRLKIDEYRRVAPGTEIVFDGGMNVLLGRNGTGKTTLLELISMCLRSNFSTLEREEFSIEYEVEHSKTRLRIRISNKKSEDLDASIYAGIDNASLAPLGERAGYDCAIAIEIASLLTQASLRSHISGTRVQVDESAPEKVLRPLTNPLRDFFDIVIIGYAVFFTKHAQSSELQIGDFNRFYRSHLNTASSAYRFDESLRVFHAIEGRSLDTAGPPPLTLTVRLKSDKTIVLKTGFFPAALATYAARRLTANRDAVDITATTDELEFLQRFVQFIGLRSAEMKAALKKRERDGEDEQVHFGDFRFLLSLADGSMITQDLLSYGQKRLLAFLYYVDCNESVIVADELVNGLHHEWIEACLDAIGERQAFLTSQNPLLLDYIPFESAEQAARRFIVCRSEEIDGRHQMRWANMPAKDAETFYRGYLAGIQHVSEILRTEGLW